MTHSRPASSKPVMDTLIERYRHVRQTSLDLVAPLEPEDMVIQSMEETSPTRWHLAHTSWFFEQFLLSQRPDFEAFNKAWAYLFNSYYYSVGEMHKRPARGLLSRPNAAQILEYRDFIDARMIELIETSMQDADFEFLVTLGLAHEQQHQELMLTDIKHAFSLNPLQPAYRSDIFLPGTACTAMTFSEFPGSIVQIGFDDGQTSVSFCFDNETPRHRVVQNPFRLANRQVNNGEYAAFIADDGYQRPELWLSGGWAAIQNHRWTRPVYWSQDLDSEFSLLGQIELDPNRSVCHLSYFEADAYARWAGKRLPTEAEWESVAAQTSTAGNLLDKQQFHPGGSDTTAMSQLFGDTWEWTSAAYSAYPGFKPLSGSVGEYNAKFMCGQMVLRGGSCVTPTDHIRATYRNFFYPDARWQFSGIRLAEDF